MLLPILLLNLVLGLTKVGADVLSTPKKGLENLVEHLEFRFRELELKLEETEARMREENEKHRKEKKELAAQRVTTMIWITGQYIYSSL